jgi:hypothetical protein
VVIDRERTRDGRFIILRQVGKLAESGDAADPADVTPFDVPFIAVGATSV